jgi:type IV secretion system protein VirB9
MKTARHLGLLTALLLLLLPVSAAAQAAPTPAKWPPVVEQPPIREEVAGQDLIHITTKVRYITTVLLPDDDPIKEVNGGDGGSEEKPGNWIITVPPNEATIHIKPTKPGAETNINVTTVSGAIYSFLLREGRPDGKALTLPDIRVTVTSDRVKKGDPAVRKFYTAAEYDALQADVIVLKTQLEAAQQRAETQAAAQPKQLDMKSMHFDYGAIPNVKPFHVKAIWHDGQFTYIKHEARESPSVYETKDGEPAILDPRVPEPGLFVIPKVIDKGYLALGKERFPFTLKDTSHGN